jgi:hypothetical protein
MDDSLEHPSAKASTADPETEDGNKDEQSDEEEGVLDWTKLLYGYFLFLPLDQWQLQNFHTCVQTKEIQSDNSETRR